MASYEVWCPACNVTHAPGTKVCIHCGGRTTKERIQLRMRDAGAGGIAPLGPEGELVLVSDESPDMAPEPTSIGKTLLRSGMNLIWIAILIGISAWRVCSGEGN